MRSGSPDSGYAMAALLTAITVMSIMLGAALPIWQTAVRRERETELVFRGEQYVQAINLFSRQYGGYPSSLALLRDGKYIRRLYKDPITGEDFLPIYLGQVAIGAAGPPAQAGRGGTAGRGAAPGGRGAGPAGRGAAPQIGGIISGAPAAGAVIGVMSRSTDESIRQYNGRGHYNEWLFVSTDATQQAGAPQGAQAPGVGRGRAGAPAGRGAPGRGIPGRGLPIPGRGRI
jgi:type II secretory pathway pseudopilin PulG